jgi:hypothetical protein
VGPPHASQTRAARNISGPRTRIACGRATLAPGRPFYWESRHPSKKVMEGRRFSAP